MIRLLIIGFWLLLNQPIEAAVADTVLVAEKSQIETVEKDTTLVKKKFTIFFRTKGGTEVPAITQAYGTPIMVPAKPTRKGYIFMGWSREIPATMPAENLIIWAEWQEILPEQEPEPDPGLELTPY